VTSKWRIAVAILIVLLGAAGLVAATVQNAYQILGIQPSASATPTPTETLPVLCQNVDPKTCAIVQRSEAYGKKLVGLTEQKAINAARAKGLPVRTVSRDKEAIMVTTDLQFARIDLYVKHGIVVKTTTG
jgi:hypothetical protein